ncbi:MAG TPA: phenylacetic acid degradation protein PaaD, partial [Rhizobiales bacterium]|nr:phenylacetic acid degradation protein PaaD [Hyphomicrobiales bacterium]
NSYDQTTVASSADITFVSPARKGDKLTATAREVFRKGRSGLYDVNVHNDAGQLIASFRGRSRTIKGTVTGTP